MTGTRPAFYAARPGGWRDWWTLLHPPYTAWHLAYVVIGASLAPTVRVSRLVGTLLAFFLAVGIAAHALTSYTAGRCERASPRRPWWWWRPPAWPAPSSWASSA